MSDVKTETLKNLNPKTRSLIELHHHFSHETFDIQFIIGRARGRGGSGGFLEDLPKIGFKIETMMMMTSCKTETLNTIILKHETFD